MTDDFGRLFGALAVQRGLASPQQVSSLLKRVNESQPLDAQMVRAGWVSASARLEILTEMDSQVLAASGDVESAIRAVRSQSAEVDEFISLYDNSVRSAEKASPSVSDDAASFEQTFVRPESHASNDATGEFSDAEATSPLASAAAGPQKDAFTETVELNRFAWTESFGVGWLSGWCRGLFVTTFQVVRACQVVLNLQVVRARTIIRAGQVALIGQVVRAVMLC
jgi:hypothetical protein